MRPALILVIITIAALFAGRGQEAAAQANSLHLDVDPTTPGTQTSRIVSPSGGNFSVQVWVNNVTTTDCHPAYPGQECGLGSYTVEMTFDPAVISYQSFADGPFLRSTGRPYSFCPIEVVGRHDPANGVVSISCTTQAGDVLGPTGSGHLATVTFAPVAIGTTDLEMDDSILTDISGDPLCHWNYTPCVTEGGSVTVNYQTDVRVTKAGPASVAAPANVTYDVDVTNAGTDPALDVVVVDTLPSELDFVDVVPGSPTCVESAGVVTCDLGTMAASQVENIDITVSAGAEDAGLTPVNVADVTTSVIDTNSSNDHAEESTPVDPSNVNITKTVPFSAGYNDPGQYVLQVTSTGPSTAANVVVSDALPTEVTYSDVQTTLGSCDYSAPTVTCNLGDMAPSGPTSSATITIDVTFGSSQAIACNQATANWDPLKQKSSGSRCTFLGYDDTDGDGCLDVIEDAHGLDSADRWDFYDVPAPAAADPTPNGPRNRTVDIADALAVLFYFGANDNGEPNGNGVDYDSLKDGDWNGPVYMHPDGTTDENDEVGLRLDRSSSPAPNPPFDAGPPSTFIDIQDALAALAQFGLDCTTMPSP